MIDWGLGLLLLAVWLSGGLIATWWWSWRDYRTWYAKRDTAIAEYIRRLEEHTWHYPEIRDPGKW